ncbi:MAG: class I SAM-dependent methyltransferase [Phycisphaerales bacterium]|nr:class I SAM-dependent methyltransferase [Phycisphaerales bacterium]
MKLYSTLADWWPLLSPPDEYAREAAYYWRVISAHAQRPVKSMLELGCGGGNNASYLKQHCRLTLTDLSPQMLAISRTLNPECEHVEGDMCSLRLNQPFDAIFVHDAVMYLTKEEQLRKAMQTAFVHCAAGGLVLLVPDCTRETWVATTCHGGHDERDDNEQPTCRAMRYLEWTWDPDPRDSEYNVDFVYLLREADGAVRVEQERHRYGVFPTDTWLNLLTEVGFKATVEPCPLDGGERARCFIGMRPGEQDV